MTNHLQQGKLGEVETKILQLLLLFILLVNASAFFFPILRNDDPVLYADIAKNMVLSGDWLRLTFAHQPWLDKPHWPFWLTAISFKIFGINSFAYILPGFLFNLFGALYTYKLAKYLYEDENIALIAAVVYLSSIHLLLSNSLDLRAEAYLLGEITPAVYYWLRYSNIYAKSDSFLIKDLFLGAIFTAMAMMTKGLFTIIPVMSGSIILVLYNNKLRELFSLKWLWAVVLSFIFILPEIFALYIQFDLHPGLVVFGQTHVSGIKWFFWGSQFGRFFNAGQIAVNHVEPLHYLFFVHTFFWAFLPWSIIFCYGIFLNIKNWQKDSKNTRNFVFLSACFCPTFILFSLTKFQLDHYTNILIPFAAILTASVIAASDTHRTRVLAKIQLSLALVLLMLSLVSWFLVWQNSYIYLLFIFLLLGVWYKSAKYSAVLRLIIYSVTAICAIFVMIVFILGKYDSKYDVGYNIALQLNKNPHLPVVTYNSDSVTLQFYYVGPYHKINKLEELAVTTRPYYLVIKSTDLTRVLKLKNVRYIMLVQGESIDKVLRGLLKVQQDSPMSYYVLEVNS